VNLEDTERDLRAKLDALVPTVRAELLRTLMLPDYDRARRIGDFWIEPRSRRFAELLIDCEESWRSASGDAGGASRARRLDGATHASDRHTDRSWSRST
jgi:hypothetical protein